MEKQFNGVKVFTATLARDRETLGEKATAWLREQQTTKPGFVVIDYIVTQSSDSDYHCITISIFYAEQLEARPAKKLREQIDERRKVIEKQSTARDRIPKITMKTGMNGEPL